MVLLPDSYGFELMDLSELFHELGHAGLEKRLHALRELERLQASPPKGFLQSINWPRQEEFILQEILHWAECFSNEQKTELIEEITSTLPENLDYELSRLLSSMQVSHELLKKILPEIAALKPDRLNVWLKALYPLAEKMPQRFIEALIHSETESIRMHGLTLIALAPDESYRQSLKSLAQEKESTEEALALACLWQLGDTAFSAELYQALKQKNSFRILNFLIASMVLPGSEALQKFLPEALQHLGIGELRQLTPHLFQQKSFNNRLPDCSQSLISRAINEPLLMDALLLIRLAFHLHSKAEDQLFVELQAHPSPLLQEALSHWNLPFLSSHPRITPLAGNPELDMACFAWENL